MPVATFIDHIEAGYSLQQFLQGYSSVERAQAADVLAWHSDHNCELWLHMNVEAKQDVLRGLADSAAGRTRDGGDFTQYLEDSNED